MKLNEEDIKRLMLEQTARSTGRQNECLTEEQFLRAATGEMSKHERESAATHMTICSDCAEEYHILRSLKTVVAEVEPATYVAAAHSPRRMWYSMLSALTPPRAAIAAAASLLIILSLLVALIISRQDSNQRIAQMSEHLADRDSALQSTRESLDEATRRLDEISSLRQEPGNAETEEKMAGKEAEIARLRQSLTELSRPQLDVPIVDLDPAPAIRGRPEQTPTQIQVPRDANVFTVILNFTDRKDHPTFEVELLSSEGRKLWSGQRIRKTSTHTLNVTFSRHLAPEGRYMIRLHGLMDGEKELIAEYSVQMWYQ